MLERIWFGTISFAANGLQAALPEWLANYEKEHDALALPLKEKVGNISAATIDRLLSPVRAIARPKGRGGDQAWPMVERRDPAAR